MKTTLIVLATIVLLSITGLMMAATGVQSHSGNADWVLPNAQARNTIVAVDLGPYGVAPARWFLKSAISAAEHIEDTNLEVFLAAIEQVEAIKLRVYATEDNREVYQQAMHASIGQLTNDQWQLVLNTRDADQQVTLLQAGDENQIDGFTLMISNPENTIFLNVCGQIRVDTLSQQLLELQSSTEVKRA